MHCIHSDDLAMLQQGLDPLFVPTYNDAMQLYVNGEWSYARERLEVYVEICCWSRVLGCSCMYLTFTWQVCSVIFVINSFKPCKLRFMSGMSRYKTRRHGDPAFNVKHARTWIWGAVELAWLSNGQGRRSLRIRNISMRKQPLLCVIAISNHAAYLTTICCGVPSQARGNKHVAWKLFECVLVIRNETLCMILDMFELNTGYANNAKISISYDTCSTLIIRVFKCSWYKIN